MSTLKQKALEHYNSVEDNNRNIFIKIVKEAFCNQLDYVVMESEMKKVNVINSLVTIVSEDVNVTYYAETNEFFVEMNNKCNKVESLYELGKFINDSSVK